MQNSGDLMETGSGMAASRRGRISTLKPGQYGSISDCAYMNLSLPNGKRIKCRRVCGLWGIYEILGFVGPEMAGGCLVETLTGIDHIGKSHELLC